MRHPLDDSMTLSNPVLVGIDGDSASKMEPSFVTFSALEMSLPFCSGSPIPVVRPRDAQYCADRVSGELQWYC